MKRLINDSPYIQRKEKKKRRIYIKGSHAASRSARALSALLNIANLLDIKINRVKIRQIESGKGRSQSEAGEKQTNII